MNPATVSTSPLRIVVGLELEPPELERIRAALPDSDVVYAPEPDSVKAAISEAEVLFGGHAVTDLLSSAPHLRWVQAYSAGVNRFPMDAFAERGILLTNAAGAHGSQIAENILAMMLAFAIRLPDLIRVQHTHTWIAREFDGKKLVLDGQTLLIAGLGGIGAALAKRAAALGLHVIGVRNRQVDAPEGVAELVTRQQLPGALRRADHVALCLPLTEETTGFIGELELRAMKPTAFVYNVGRGQSLEREALLRALREGWIAGAGLDVTDPEPLPPDDALWDFPNVILTQHTSGGAPDLDRRVTDIFIDNLRRYAAGEPLRNQVDYNRRY